MDNPNLNNENALRRVPPHSAEAELAVLGSMLFDKEAVITAHELLMAEDFYRPDYRVIFEAMIGIFTSGGPVDTVTLKNELEKLGVFERVGGGEVIASLVANVTSSANIRFYAKLIRDKAMLRRLIKTSGDIAAKSFEAADEADNILEYAEKSIFDIAQRRNISDFIHIRDALSISIQEIEDIYKNGQKITGIPTGFLDFDMKTAGLHPSNLILVAARPSMGKSVLGLNIAQNAAIRNKIPTAYFSLEMSRSELVSRVLCSEAHVEAQRLRTGELDPDDWANIVRALGPISEAPLYLDDSPGITVPELRAKCRRLKLEKGLGLIVVDYLQLMNGSKRAESRQQEISEISRSLKSIAREMEAPVIALAQLSRACEQRADHRPILSDLRESGAIEQDADVVAFIYRDEYYYPDTEKRGIAELIIAKQRNGPTGTVELAFIGNYVKFNNLVRQ
ncbi:MAG: replicative DNA helicase [Clostridiales bacterium]|jgi:replicative DNA helicase|nr:replicative DNA helicase [Clostridiales bacterium]